MDTVKGVVQMNEPIEMESEEVQMESEEVRVRAWRVEQLGNLGLSTFVAEAAADFVDWHEVAPLVDKGCPPELALEIAR